jgi:exopolysaccharide biosynthesis polyprenyl glycosylphosphotransferase
MTITAPARAPAAAPLPRERTHRAGVVGARFTRWLLPAVDGAALLVVAGVADGSGWARVGYLVAVLGLLAVGGQHRLRICLRLGDQLPWLLLAAAAPAVILLWYLPANAVPMVVIDCAAALVLFRAVCYPVLRAVRRRGLLCERALIVGAGATAVELAAALREHREFGLVVSGHLDDRPPLADQVGPVLGGVDDLARVVARDGIGRVLVCFPAESDENVAAVLRAARPLAADVCVVPRLYELGAAVSRYQLDEVWGIPLVPLRHHLDGGAAGVVKRIADLLGAAVLVPLLVPVSVGLGIAMLLRSGRPALFHQIRVGKAGRLVSVPKLRTLTDSRDADTCWQVGAERQTGLGRWLRTTHLDELPQLITVLRGGMSLVGPRPERPYFACRFGQEIPGYRDRHRMPAGMTGWAQVHGLCGDTSIPQRVRFDNQYVEYWSPWLDLVILVRTVGAVAGIRKRGIEGPPARAPEKGGIR